MPRPLDDEPSLVEQLISLPYLLHDKRVPPERLEIMRLNRPTPKIAVTEQMSSLKLKKDVYVTYPWLTACDKTQRMYCWYCLLLPADPMHARGDDGLDEQTLRYHACRMTHKDAVNLYARIVNILNVRSDVQIRILPSKRLEVLSDQQLRETFELDAQIEKKYLDEIHKDENKDGVAKLLSFIRDETITPEILDIFKSGRPRPMLPYLHYVWIRVKGRYVRIIKEYAQFQWLAGCPSTQNLYCWQCLLFQRTSKLERWSTYMASDHSESGSHNITIKLYRQLKNILQNNSCNFKEIRIIGDKLVVVESEIVDAALCKVSTVKVTKPTNKRNKRLRKPCLRLVQLCSALNPVNPIYDNKELEPVDIFDTLIVHQPYINSLHTLTREILQIVRAGRPTPIMPNLNVPYIPYVLPYDDVPWLTACNVRKEIYCWVCLLFSTFDKSLISKYTRKGLNQLRNKIHFHSHSRLHVGAQEVYDKALAQCGGATARELPRDEVKDCWLKYGQRTEDLSNNETGDSPASSYDVVTSTDCDHVALHRAEVSDDNHPPRPESELVLEREDDPDVDATLRTPHTFETVFLPEIFESSTETSQPESSSSSESTVACNSTQHPNRVKRKIPESEENPQISPPQITTPQKPLPLTPLPQTSLPQIRLPQTPLPQTPLLQIRLTQTPLLQVLLSQTPLPQTPLPQTPLPQTPLPQIPLSQTPFPQIPVPQIPLPQTPEREDLPVTPNECVVVSEDVTSSVDTVLTNKRTSETCYCDFSVKKLKCVGGYLTLTECPLEEGEIKTIENLDLLYERNKPESHTWQLTLLNGDNIKTCLVLS